MEQTKNIIIKTPKSHVIWGVCSMECSKKFIKIKESKYGFFICDPKRYFFCNKEDKI